MTLSIKMEDVIKFVLIFMEATAVTVKMVIIYSQIKWTARVRKKSESTNDNPLETKSSFYVMK